jgi:hypothetical protein
VTNVSGLCTLHSNVQLVHVLKYCNSFSPIRTVPPAQQYQSLQLHVFFCWCLIYVMLVSGQYVIKRRDIHLWWPGSKSSFHKQELSLVGQCRTKDAIIWDHRSNKNEAVRSMGYWSISNRHSGLYLSDMMIRLIWMLQNQFLLWARMNDDGDYTRPGATWKEG